MEMRLVPNRKPLRVGYVLKRFPRFSETFIVNELLELERQGVQVEVFSLLHPPEEPRHDFLSRLKAPVTYLPRARAMGKWTIDQANAQGDLESRSVTDSFSDQAVPFQDLFPGKEALTASHLCLQATTLAMLANARGIGHLHAHFGSNATTVAMLAGRLGRIPYSFTAHARDIYHTYISRSVDDGLRKRKIDEARFVATVSDYNRTHLENIAGRGSSNKVHRLYNGIDLSRFQRTDAEREPDFLLAVGRLVEKKGFPHLVEACGLLQQRGVRFRCLIIGDGPEREPLAMRIAELGLQESVLLPGGQTQEELINTMTRAAAIVLPCVVSASGDRDGLPTVLLEGMAMELPAVSTHVAGVPEIIAHEETGLLVPPENPERLADALQALLDDPDKAAEMGRRGRERAERLFNLETNVARLRNWFTHSIQGVEIVTEEANENCIHSS